MAFPYLSWRRPPQPNPNGVKTEGFCIAIAERPLWVICGQIRSARRSAQAHLYQNSCIEAHLQNPSLLNTFKEKALAIVVALNTAIYPQDARSDSLTAADLATWEQKTRDWYLQTAITMAGIISAQTDDVHARCINQWYFAPEVDMEALHSSVMDVMARFPEEHPGTVIWAVIHKQCGDLRLR